MKLPASKTMRLLAAGAVFTALAGGGYALQSIAGTLFHVDNSAVVNSGAELASSSFKFRNATVGVPVITSTSSATFALVGGTAAGAIVSGDANNDGAIDQDDADAILAAFAAKQPNDYFIQSRGDVAPDGQIDNQDAQKVHLFANGTLTQLP